MAANDSFSLVVLKEKGSTARALNLLRFYLNGNEAPPEPGLFRNKLLKRCIVTKHCMRPDESSLFADHRRAGTKIILPINSQDLRLGGRYFMVGQKRYDVVRQEIWGDSHEDRQYDEQVLQILEKAPSLDPFLLREVLQRHGVKPNALYLDLSENDLDEMFEFARQELIPLSEALFGEGAGETDAAIRLVRKLLFNDASEEIEPLRLALRLEKENYAEGMFAWKGFLYFKWQFSKIMEEAPKAAAQIGAAFPTGEMDNAEKQMLAELKRDVASGVIALTETIPPHLDAYDEALGQLTGGGDATAFRDFLLNSPKAFVAVGERMGVLSHISTIWTYLFPNGGRAALPGGELLELLMEFEELLKRYMPPRAQAAPPPTRRAAAG